MPTTPDRQRPFFVVLNRRSGSGDAGATEAAIRSTLDAAGRSYRLFCAKHPRHLGELAGQAVEAARAQDGAVVVVGGDGTINAVVQVELPSGLPLGVLPQGTFNFFGRTHGISADTHEAVGALLAGTPRNVQAGMVNDRLFLVNASLGLYPQVLEDREAWKQRLETR